MGHGKIGDIEKKEKREDIIDTSSNIITTNSNEEEFFNKPKMDPYQYHFGEAEDELEEKRKKSDDIARFKSKMSMNKEANKGNIKEADIHKNDHKMREKSEDFDEEEEKQEFNWPIELMDIKHIVELVLADTKEAGKEYRALKTAATTLLNKVTKADLNEKEYSYTAELLALYDASNHYYLTHKGFKWTTNGQLRRDNAKSISDKISDIISTNKVVQGIIIDECIKEDEIEEASKNKELKRDENGKTEREYRDEFLFSIAKVNVEKDIEKLKLNDEARRYTKNIDKVTVKLMARKDRKERCIVYLSKVLEEKYGIHLKSDDLPDGMNKQVLYKLIPSFRMNSDGTAATPEDEILKEKAISMARAFFDEKLEKRDKYLKEIINKYINAPTNLSYYIPSKLEKNVDLYCENVELAEIFEGLFFDEKFKSQIAYNKGFLELCPETVINRLLDKVNALKVLKTYSEKLYKNVHSYDIAEKTFSLKEIKGDANENYDDLCKKVFNISNQHTLVCMDMSSNNPNWKMVKTVMDSYGKNFVTRQEILNKVKVEGANNADAANDNKILVSAEFMQYIQGLKRDTEFVEKNTKTECIAELVNICNENESKEILSAATQNSNVDNLDVEIAMDNYYTACAHSGVNVDAKKVIEKYLIKKYGDTNPMIHNNNVRDIIIDVRTKHRALNNYIKASEYYDVISKNYTAGDINRKIEPFLKLVRYDDNNKPLNHIDVNNDYSNKEVLKAFAKKNVNVLYKHYEKYINAYDKLTLDKNLYSPDKFLGSLKDNLKLSYINLKISNIDKEFKEFGQKYKKKDKEKYDRVNKKQADLAIHMNYLDSFLLGNYFIKATGEIENASKDVHNISEKTCDNFIEMLYGQGMLDILTEDERKVIEDAKVRKLLEEKYRRECNQSKDSYSDKLIYNQGSKAESEVGKRVEKIVSDLKYIDINEPANVDRLDQIFSNGSSEEVAAALIVLNSFSIIQKDNEGIEQVVDYQEVVNGYREKIKESREDDIIGIEYMIHAYRNVNEKKILGMVENTFGQRSLKHGEKTNVSNFAVKCHDDELGVMLRASKKAEMEFIGGEGAEFSELARALKTAKEKGYNDYSNVMDELVYSDARYVENRSNIKKTDYSDTLKVTRDSKNARARAIGLKVFSQRGLINV